MNDVYCPAAWIGLNILPSEARPCCQWTGAAVEIDASQDLTSSDIFNMFEPLRQVMLKGGSSPGCAQCYSAEKVGAKSRRQELIEQYGNVTTVSTRILDISFDNVCNLKCRGCRSYSSHMWYNDEKELYGETFGGAKYLDHNTEFDLTNIEYINVSGGEPFLSKKFRRFASKLLTGHIVEKLHLCITSNATTLPPDEIYQLMLEVNNLSLSLSIDGIGKLNQYFRHGADFETCLATIEFFKDLKDKRGDKSTSLNIHTTVNVYNVNLLKEIKTFFSEKYPEYTLSHRLLYWPAQLCIGNLPDDLKNQIRPIVEGYGEEYSDVLNELNTDGIDSFGHFINFHNSLDALRSESLDGLNPLLSNYIQQYKNPHNNSKEFLLKQMRGE